jgi:flagellar hook-basal body complex protein FliE
MSPLAGIQSYRSNLLPRVAPLPGAEDGAIPSVMPGAAAAGKSDFSSLLGKMVSEVNAQQLSSAQNVNALQAGQNIPLHQAVIGMEEASVSFQLMVEVRNKLLESYQEIMRMQV